MKVNLCPCSYVSYTLVQEEILKRSSFPQSHRNDTSCLDLLIYPLHNIVFKYFLGEIQRDHRLG